jgi:hypothetical protein
MRYEPPAIEHRLGIEARLGVVLPSGQPPRQPVWRSAKPGKTASMEYEPPAVEGRLDIRTEAGRIINVSGDRQPVWRPAPPPRD